MFKFRYKMLFVPLISGVLILSACGSGDRTGDPSLLSKKDSGEIVPLQELFYDWKDINIEGGTVNYVFKFRNDGDSDLILKSAVTTCMCTSAVIELSDGSASPTFGMHANTSWGVKVNPGEEFSVNVTFDPMAHGPNATGPITRSVFLQTSSVINGEYAKSDPSMGGVVTEMKLQGNVQSKDVYERTQELNASGGIFNFTEQEFDFGVVKQSAGLVSHDFEFEYLGEEPVSITALPSSCACTSAEISSQTFKKGDKGTLTVVLDPNLHEEPEGKFFKTVSILTDPKLEEQSEVKIWAEIDLDLGPEAYKLKEPHNDEVEGEISYHNVSAEDFADMLGSKDFFLLDVHTPEQEHIDGTDAFIPYDEISAHLDELPEDKSQKIIVYCRSGSMSFTASQELVDLGYTNVINLEGGRDAFVELTN